MKGIKRICNIEPYQLTLECDNNEVLMVHLEPNLKEWSKSPQNKFHVGSGEGSSDGSKAFIQKSDGTIVEIMQPNLPYKDIKTGRTSWKAK